MKPALLSVRAVSARRTDVLVFTPFLRGWTVPGLVKRLVEGRRRTSALVSAPLTRLI